MSSDALKRVNSFVAAAKANGKKVTKKSPKQVVKKAHDKIQARLDKIAKKYGVNVRLNRNKNKLPSVIVTGLKKLPYSDVAKLFSEIPNSSPVPQKMDENKALFRIFAKRKVTASITAGAPLTKKEKARAGINMQNKKLKDLKIGLKKNPSKEATIKKEIKTIEDRIKKLKVILTASTEDRTYTLTVKDGDNSLWSLLEYIKKCGDDGHSISFTIDDQMFGFDGDGADKILTLNQSSAVQADESDENENLEEEDDSDDSESEEDGSEDDSEDDDEDTTEEDEANKKDMIAFINDNKIAREDLFPLSDKAANNYNTDLKENAPLEDLVGFIYDILGPEDSKNALKSIANKQSQKG